MRAEIEGAIEKAGGQCGRPLLSVTEQPHTGEGHDDAVFVSLADDQIVPEGSI